MLYKIKKPNQIKHKKQKHQEVYKHNNNNNNNKTRESERDGTYLCVPVFTGIEKKG